jgi:hypothetical protein
MRGVTRADCRARVLAPALLAAAVALFAAVPPIPAAAAEQTAAGLIGGGCNYHQIAGGYQWVCTDNSAAPGTATSGGSGPGPACTLTAMTPQQAAVLGLPAPPAGHAWDLVSCGGPQPFVGTMLVTTGPGGTPAVTPQQLAQIAVGDLVIPGLDPDTAPPAGKDGLVGLPEWFWVPPADWHPVQTRTVRAGPVWAVATATPEKIVFSPGGGLATVQCLGPGTAYNPAMPSSAQHTDCSYTYDQPSAGQPGNAYAATVAIGWNVSWVGSGGAGGTVAADRLVGTPLTLPVAAGEALVTGG